MSDLSDLEGVYPSSLRFNAQDGILGYSAYNPETGERELKPIEFGIAATYALDLLTRMRGYGYIRVGAYDVRLTPVGDPPPPWPGDPDFKPAIGCWLWCPAYGELRLETCSSYFRTAISNIWDKAWRAPQAATGLQPVIRFTECLTILNKKVGKTFYVPKIEIVGWVERDKIPGWSARTPTVSLPAPLPILSITASTPSSQSTSAAPAKKSLKDKPGDGLIDDDLPESLR